mmetsp:Transcript_21015/g.56036  ORF Transcript_21015/g.56036 Transcript_21015/m.56036 type:complete len:213 (-) Transcript_21015:141-779(-)
MTQSLGTSSCTWTPFEIVISRNLTVVTGCASMWSSTQIPPKIPARSSRSTLSWTVLSEVVTAWSAIAAMTVTRIVGAVEKEIAKEIATIEAVEGRVTGAGVKVVAVAVGLVAFIARNAKVPVRVRRRDRAPAAARANAAPANAAPADRADGLQGRIKASAARVKVAAVAAAGGDGRDHVVLCSWKIDGGVFRPWETVLREVPSSTALAEAET